MENKEELRKLGLTKYQANAYLTLVEEGSMIARELADKSSVPQPKIYATLKELEDLNLIETLPDFPKKYKAVNPSIGLTKLLENKKESLWQIEKEFIKIEKELEKKYKKSKAGEEEYFWMAKRGKKEFIEKMMELADESQKEILFFTLHFSVYPELKKKFINAKKRGVRIKVIGALTPETKEVAKVYKKMGCEIRQLKHNYPRFILVDGKKVGVRIGNFYINVVVEDKSFAQIFKSFFEEQWKKAKKINV